LEDGGDALEAHAGVHARLGKWSEDTIGSAIKLHEDKVPDFDVPATVAGKRAIGVTVV